MTVISDDVMLSGLEKYIYDVEEATIDGDYFVLVPHQDLHWLTHIHSPFAWRGISAGAMWRSSPSLSSRTPEGHIYGRVRCFHSASYRRGR